MAHRAAHPDALRNVPYGRGRVAEQKELAAAFLHFVGEVTGARSRDAYRHSIAERAAAAPPAMGKDQDKERAEKTEAIFQSRDRKGAIQTTAPLFFRWLRGIDLGDASIPLRGTAQHQAEDIKSRGKAASMLKTADC